ncbi:DUF4838 domain-containing protein [Paenibacillus eucommiae]|uniref:SLH domain-containing protein n=1 Tax=Paenibacillus eucommiae TaxID=1355755 RepID=A0ABS4J5N8_9BACL|nr:DUF4838 domain-containing protein [Paenibacillus eucommiae]MBP1995098.1 hypothetical protein [Paenibacillus eucommiae]
MVKKWGLKYTAICLIICMIFSSFGTAFGAEAKSDSKSDLKGHWAEAQMNSWMQQGFIQGYPDGSVKPDNSITRAEFMTLVNSSFGFTEKAEVSSTDVKATDWFYDQVAMAVQAGYISGYPDGTMGPNKSISRQEAAVIVDRLLGLTEMDQKEAAAFSDAGQIASWSIDAVKALVSNGILNGYEGNLFKPLHAITRAEAVVTLERAIQTKPGIYNTAGTFGPEAGTETLTGNAAIHVTGVTLRNMAITGKLLFGKGIAEGDASLAGVTVKGTTTVSGGGVNSIYIEDSALAEVIIDKDGAVRIVVKGSTTIESLIVRTPGAILELGEGTKVGKLTIHAAVKVTGKGTIAVVDEKVAGSTFETKPVSSVTPAPGMTASPSPGSTLAPSATPGPGTTPGPTATPGPSPTPGPGTTPGPTATPGPSPTPDPGKSLNIVEAGQAKGVIIVAADANSRMLAAAQTLSDYVQESTGARLLFHQSFEPIDEESLAEDVVRIYVGMKAPEDEQQVNGVLEGLPNDGFVIVPSANRITIIGPTISGTEFGVYDFLERYVGVSWLLPGPDGDDVPEHQTITVSGQTVRNEPVNISRQFFGTEFPIAIEGVNNAANAEWAKHNRLLDNIQFHHNMSKLFDPEVFDKHPEYYPGGVVPTHAFNWQPCFNDTTAEVAIERIKAYFDANPDQISYSLGTNDSSNYCEANLTDKKNSIGAVDMSDFYYPWVNKVVEGVLKNEKYKDKYFGLLAYWNVYDPPANLKLHERVIPYITDDRMSWIDPDMEAIGVEHTEKWQQAATNLGFYEYLYGAPYNVPRVYLHKMADNYKYGQENSVIAHVAELYPNYGEGPKPWLSAKLQWNPNQDTDTLLQEWYERAVGAEAAPYLQQYYALWEDFWTTRIFETAWYKAWATSPNRNNFMNMDDHSYLNAVTKEDMAESRRLMEQVMDKAQTGKQQTRAALLMRTFEYYEASALSFPRTSAVTTPSNEQEALALLDDVKLSVELAKKRLELRKQFKGNPVLEILDYPNNGGIWDGMQKTFISALERYTLTEPDNGVVGERLNQFLEEHSILSARAVKTTASKEDILQSLDFSKGPWTDAAPFNNFYIMNTTTEGPVETKVYLLWDKENLYVGYENFHSDPAKMVVSNDITAGGWWSSGGDDSVETFLSGDLKKGYRGFFTNPNSVKFIYNKDAGKSYEFNTQFVDWSANAATANDKWNLVQVIPFSSIGVDTDATKQLQGFFFRNYRGNSVYLGWGGGAPWTEANIHPIYLIDAEQAEIQSVSAQEGTISVQLNQPPLSKPGANDFTIEQSFNGGSGIPVTPVDLKWNAATRTAAIKVPVSAAATEQSVVYSVSYKGQTAVQTAPLQLAPVVDLHNLLQNPSFEAGDGSDTAPPWDLGWAGGEGGTITRTDAIQRTDTYSLEGTGLTKGGSPYQGNIPVEPGLYQSIIHYYIPEDSETNGTIQWMNIVKTNGVDNYIVTDKVPVSTNKGIWQELELIFEVSAASTVLFNFPSWDFLPGEKIYFDDAALYRLDRPVVDETAITAVSAQEGAISVQLSQIPLNEPEANDFTIEQSFNGNSGIAVTPKDLQWNEAAQTVVLVVPIPAAATQQSVVYKVSYKGQTAVEAAPLQVAPVAGLVNLLQNPSFEAGNGSATAPPWDLDWAGGEGGTITRTDAIQKTGTYSLEGSGLTKGGSPYQGNIAVEPGLYQSVVHYFVPEDSAANGMIQWMNIVKTNGVDDYIVTDKVPVSTHKGTWQELELIFEVSASSTVLVNFPSWDFLPGEKIYFDDAALYRLDGQVIDDTKVTAVSVQEGKVNVHLSQIPKNEPVASDFIIEQSFNGGSGIPVTPTAFYWNAASQTAVFTVPSIPAASTKQSVVYKAAYNNQAHVEAAALQIEPVRGLVNILDNASFELGDGTGTVPHWDLSWTGGNGTLKRSSAVKRTGTYSLEGVGLTKGGSPYQANVSVKPGLYQSVIHYFIPADSATNGSIQWMNILKVNGADLYLVNDKVSVSTNKGTWQELEVVFRVSSYTTVLINFPSWDFLPDEKIYFDDAALYRLGN